MLMLAASLAIAAQTGTTTIIPMPAQIQPIVGAKFPTIQRDRILIEADKELGDVAKMLIENLNHDGASARIGSDKSTNTIRIHLSTSLKNEVGDEGYSMRIQHDGIWLSAATPAGAFYGTQSIRQLLDKGKNKSVQLATQVITDKPRFGWRGMHIDCSRHFFTVAELKNYIDQLVRYKFNTFHWHIIDEGGWRMESKKYPKLTSVGAWRTPLQGEIWNYSKMDFPGPSTGKQLYGGFYTQKEIKEIVAYAKRRFVTTVPEIEMPGHSLPALVAYPEVSCSVEKGPDRPYRTTCYCAGKEQTFKFLEDILDETMELFPSEVIHIGGDEVDKYFWTRCPDCQARMKQNNLKDVNELQSYFVKRIEKYLNSKGRRMMGWDEILEGGLAPNAEVMSWRGEEGGIAAAKSGHKVVMSPTSHCYFDYSYAAIPTEHVYNYDPIPKELNATESKMVLGAQANVWTEWMADYKRVQEMIFPRMLAMSETLWTPKENKNYADFQKRMEAAYARFVREGTQFFVEQPEADSGLIMFAKSCQVTFKVPPVPGYQLRYTTDGSDPKTNSKRYEGPITITKDCTVMARGFIAGKSVGDAIKVRCSPSAGKMVTQMAPSFRLSTGGYDKLPDFSKIPIAQQGPASNFSIDSWKGMPTFAVEWQGVFSIKKAGKYRFRLTSDDGSALWIDGIQVVNHDGPHAANEKVGSAELLPGDYPFVLQYFEQGGAEAFKATVDTPDGNVPLEKIVREWRN